MCFPRLCRKAFTCVVALSCTFLFVTDSVGEKPFVFQPGDRVVFLGDSLVEQEQYFGWIESALTMRTPAVDVRFRNLGWNADTPAGSSRLGLSLMQAGNEPADEGWNQLVKQLELTSPTVLIVGYGMAAALESGASGVQAFRSDYQRLIDQARQMVSGVRFVLLSPLQIVDQQDPFSAVLADYRNAVEELAQANAAWFIDLSPVAIRPEQRRNRVHLNERGYQEVAAAVVEKLSPSAGPWQAEQIPQSLRDAIIRKNVWWFHRSRPANMAYVFGFRKREQGQNAVEIPRFDALVAAEEKVISQLVGGQAVPAVPAPVTQSKYAEFTPQPRPQFTVADGWEVELWAENPLLNKPIQMNFDPQGRLWIASSEAYPMIEVGQAAPDRILVLEDTNGDGKADKTTTFADGLLIPTGLAPGHGGVYVAQSTDLLFLKDTTGDGIADHRERLLSGFGTEDTHHNLHSLQWGPDGRLYMNQSVYTRTDTETPFSVVRLRAGGGFRLDPTQLRMQVFFRGLWNSWGHQFDAFGQSFLTDGAGFRGVAWGFPGAVFHPTPGARRQLDLISPGNYPKFAAAEIVAGPSYPEDWQETFVTCDFRANRVTQFLLQDQDAGFVAIPGADLLRTSETTFRPIDVKQGPDGALYIADWSNPIINHGEVDFRDPRRDRWHGRIWKVRWTGGQRQEVADLTLEKTELLLDKLVAADRYTRDQSRRVLFERADSEDVSAVLAAWLQQPRDDRAKLQALWICQGLNLVRPDLLRQLLRSDIPQVAAAAVRVLADWSDPQNPGIEVLESSHSGKWFSEAVVHPHPRVRLEAIRGLSVFGSVDAVAVAMKALKLPKDRFIEFAAAQLVDDHAQAIVDAILSGTWTEQISFVLENVPPQQSQRCLESYLKTNPIGTDGGGPWIELVGRTGNPIQLQRLLDQATSGGFVPEATARVLRTFSEADRLRRIRPQGDLTRVTQFLNVAEVSVRKQAVELVGRWKLESARPRLLELATATEETLPIRIAAVNSLRQLGDASAVAPLRKLIEVQQNTSLRQSALVTLFALNQEVAVAAFWQVLEGSENEPQAVSFWQAALQNAEIGKRLAVELPEKNYPPHVIAAGLHAITSVGREETELRDALQKIAGTKPEMEFSAQRIRELQVAVAERGNPDRGQEIYWRENLQCINCHAIAGVGGQVGPDLSSLGASAPVDYIIESLYLPDAKIKEGFHSLVVATEDGEVFAGIETNSTAEELVLRQADDQLVRIPTAEIVAQKAGPSLMPSGVVDRLSEQEQIDLIRFLTELGRPGRFDASQGGIARRFQVFAGTHRAEQQGMDKVIQGQADSAGRVLLARVDGTVTTSMLAEVTKQPINISLVNVYLLTRFTTTTAGEIEFEFVGGENHSVTAAWVDGASVKPLPTQGNIVTALDAGEHVLVIRLDARALPDSFRLRSGQAIFQTQW